jgi:flagellar biosynthesis/type III secretory pathway protein FliH
MLDFLKQPSPRDAANPFAGVDIPVGYFGNVGIFNRFFSRAGTAALIANGVPLYVQVSWMNYCTVKLGRHVSSQVKLVTDAIGERVLDQTELLQILDADINISAIMDNKNIIRGETSSINELISHIDRLFDNPPVGAGPEANIQAIEAGIAKLKARLDSLRANVDDDSNDVCVIIADNMANWQVKLQAAPPPAQPQPAPAQQTAAERKPAAADRKAAAAAERKAAADRKAADQKAAKNGNGGHTSGNKTTSRNRTNIGSILGGSLSSTLNNLTRKSSNVMNYLNRIKSKKMLPQMLNRSNIQRRLASTVSKSRQLISRIKSASKSLSKRLRSRISRRR